MPCLLCSVNLNMRWKCLKKKKIVVELLEED